MAAPKFGYQMITWADLEKPAGGHTLQQAAADIAQVGFRGVESFNFPEYHDRVDEFRMLYEPHGLALASVYFGADMTDPEKIPQELAGCEAAARFVAVQGCRQLVLGPGGRKPEGHPAEDYHRMADTMNRMGEICLRHGLELALHPHWGTTVQTPEELHGVMELTDPSLLFLAPDTAHIKRGGGDPADIMRRYASRIRYVHLKDLDESGEFVELGQGTIDFRPIMEILDGIGFDGWCVVELDRTRRTPIESAQISKRYIEDVLGREV